MTSESSGNQQDVFRSHIKRSRSLFGRALAHGHNCVRIWPGSSWAVKGALGCPLSFARNDVLGGVVGSGEIGWLIGGGDGCVGVGERVSGSGGGCVTVVSCRGV